MSSSSASARGESEDVKKLRKENAALMKELSEIKLLHEQMLHENPHETILEKRVNILKSQLFQLERQMVILSDVVNGYAGVHLELHRMLEDLTDGFSSGKQSSDDVVKSARQIQRRLSKSNRGSVENNAMPLLFMDNFVNPTILKKSNSREVFDSEYPVSVLDICSGKTDHINLKKVGQLESKLAKLYGELIKLQSSFEVTPTSLPSLLQPARERSKSRMTSCCELIGECCHDLLCISLLVPSAPWPNAKKMVLPQELNSCEIMKKMSPAIRNKKEVREAVEKACNCFVQLSDINAIKCKALEEELHFHKSVYQLQVNYVEALFDAMRQGYETFEKSVQDLVCSPLKEILDCYDVLSSTASDIALREFLQQMKKSAPQLRSAVNSLCSSTADQLGGTKALSAFGENFFQTLFKLEKEQSGKHAQESSVNSDEK